MAICAALDVTPEYLLSGISEDSDRGREVEYMVIPKGTEERILLEILGELDWLERKHLMEYAKRLSNKSKNASVQVKNNMKLEKIAEFCDIEVFMDSEFRGQPSVELNYIDDVQGSFGL